VNKQFPISNFQFPNVRVIQFDSEDVLDVQTPLPGDWNIENVLAATLLARSVGVDEEAISQGVATVKQVPGRMEWVAEHVLIDYAVTPGALGQLYKYVRSDMKGKIFAVLENSKCRR